MITVVGSLNIDLNVTLSHFPKQGETLLSQQFFYSYGGKGGNQAVAISRLNGDVRFIGAVGNDVYGKDYIHKLKREGIDIAGICCLEDVATGTAVVMLAQKDNAIIVTQGANGLLSVEHVEKHAQHIIQSQYIVMQFEVRDDVIEYVLQLASQYSIPVILNPAPFRVFPESWVEHITYLTPNETEYEALCKSGITIPKEKLILTMGKQGVSYFDAEAQQVCQIEAPQVHVVDTTGAGDTFNGALAHYLTQGYTLKQACSYAVIAASLSTEHANAQAGMPTHQHVLEKYQQEIE
ncbi:MULTISPECIES: ribokinase [unclassified Granulicatella]|uniref:ribokinase n=1 Tax=unclassified Granulicatella TaxID=2630493 RepID=UPI0010741A98|nr:MULTISPECIES: ribokinase [unclassified Granulicatella]MBF0779833.1 ribokinase [Granulicatella sp. 19428wC4_WM01]TFU96133.1 ribokinase [Granulicatella sp. WM01]